MMLNEQVKKASINYNTSSGDPGEKENSFQNDHWSHVQWIQVKTP